MARNSNEHIEKRRNLLEKLVDCGKDSRNHKYTKSELIDKLKKAGYGEIANTFNDDIEFLNMYVSKSSERVLRKKDTSKDFELNELNSFLQGNLLSVWISRNIPMQSLFISIKDYPLIENPDGTFTEKEEEATFFSENPEYIDDAYFVTLKLKKSIVGYESAIANLIEEIYGESLIFVTTGIRSIIIFVGIIDTMEELADKFTEFF